jgi:hypothetical protein
MGVNISALSGPQGHEEIFLTQNSEHLTIKFLTSAENIQRKD